MRKVKNIKTFIAWAFGMGLFVNALFFIPQTVAIIKNQSAQDVSVWTFGFFCAMQFIGILHGYYQQDKAVFWGMLASFISCGVLTGAIIYFRWIF